MSSPGRAGGERLRAGAILAASALGAGAATRPWHSLMHGGVEVSGVERLEGKVLVVALGFAAAHSLVTIVSGRRRLAGGLVVATGIALAAAGFYLVVLARPESRLHELVRTALGGAFAPGVLVSTGSSAVAFAPAVSSWHGGRSDVGPRASDP